MSRNEYPHIKLINPKLKILLAIDGIKMFDWHPFDDLIAISSPSTIKKHFFYIYDYKTTKTHKVISQNTTITSISWNHKGNRVVTSSDDGYIKLWDKSGSFINSLHSEYHWIRDVRWAPNDKFLLSCSGSSMHNGGVYLWSKDINLIGNISKNTHYVDWHPNGDNFVVVKGGQRISNNAINLWNTDGFHMHSFEPIPTVNKNAWRAFWSKDGSTLAVVSLDNILWLWDYNGSYIGNIPFDSRWSWNHMIDWNPLNNMIASPYENTIQIWDKLSLVMKLEGHKSGICSIKWNPEGNILASGSADNTIRLWDLSGKCISILDGHSDDIMDISWSSDGKKIVSASRSYETFIWLLEEQEEINKS